VLDTLYIDAVEQADALLKPKRVEVLRQLAEPRTCTQIGQVLGDTPQAVYYHVKRLQAHGLVSLVEEHRVRGIIEGVYQAVAKSFWVSPAIVGRLGDARTREAQLGLGFLLDLTENMQRDLAQLASGPPTLPSFGIAGDIRLAPEDGAAFVSELQRAFGEVLTRYGGGEGHAFRLALACYPNLPPRDAE
jgi:DNA-binding transcriptional ArsR family regulator